MQDFENVLLEKGHKKVLQAINKYVNLDVFCPLQIFYNSDDVDIMTYQNVQLKVKSFHLHING